jgi:hypothetical protein
MGEGKPVSELVFMVRVVLGVDWGTIGYIPPFIYLEMVAHGKNPGHRVARHFD